MDVSIAALLVATLATYRLVRLWLWDTIAAPLHNRVTRWLFTRGKAGVWLGELVTCQWCLGVWVSAAVTAAWWTIAALWDGPASVAEWLLVSLAVAAGQSLLHLVEDRLAEDD